MTDILRLLFWVWLFGSLGVLAMRTLNKRNKVAAAPSTGGLSIWDSLLGKKLPDPGTRPPSGGTDGTWPLVSGSTPAPPSPGPGSVTAAEPSIPSVESPIPPTPDSTGADPSARQGLFAAVGATPAPSPTSTSSVTTVAEALTGMAWPCGLTPVIDLAAHHAADRQVTFSTTEAAAPEVGRRLGDALEALGYRLRSTSDTVVEAYRPGATVEVRIHPEAGTTERSGVATYPSLPPMAVVVVFSLLSA